MEQGQVRAAGGAEMRDGDLDFAERRHASRQDNGLARGRAGGEQIGPRQLVRRDLVERDVRAECCDGLQVERRAGEGDMAGRAALGQSRGSRNDSGNSHATRARCAALRARISGANSSWTRKSWNLTASQPIEAAVSTNCSERGDRGGDCSRSQRRIEGSRGGPREGRVFGNAADYASHIGIGKTRIHGQ